jgi:SAM-dependent methyltransferase
MKRVRCPDLSVGFGDGERVVLRAVSRGRAARVPALAVGVLAACGEPRSEDEVAAEFGEAGRQLFRGLERAGFLVSPEQAHDTPMFFENFGAIDVHRRMLADGARLDAYQAALREVVGPTTVVADAGTGSGVLACLAAGAGARGVYGVDRSDLLDVAERIVAKSGMADKVTLVRGDLRDVTLPEPVDVIVTETFGALALAEGSPADVAAFARRCLAPGGLVVPSAVQLWLAPMSDEALLDEALGPFEPARGVDLSPLGDVARGRGVSREIPAASLVHPGVCFARLDYPSTPWPAATVTFDGGASARPGGRLTGFAAWFVLELTASVHLPTGPADPLTHWRQVYLPLADGPALADEPLTLDIHVEAASDDRRSIDVALTIRAGATTRHARYRVR